MASKRKKLEKNREHTGQLRNILLLEFFIGAVIIALILILINLFI